METKELSDIYRMLGELIEAIKSYDKVSSIKNKYGDRIVFLCGTLWLKESFKACVFYDYIKRQKSDDFYINKIAAQLKEVVELGIDSFSMCIMRGLNEETHYYVLKNNGEYIWRERFKMFCELDQEANEILEIYNHVFPNSRVDNTGSNKKEPKELTEREIKYYGKAIEAGMAEKTEQGYRWLGSNVSFGYFIDKVHRPKATERLPYKRMEKLWGIKRLDSAVSQSADRKHKWEKDIDALFEE